MKNLKALTKRLLAITVILVTLLSTVYAADLADPYGKNAIARPSITTLQSK